MSSTFTICIFVPMYLSLNIKIGKKRRKREIETESKDERNLVEKAIHIWTQQVCNESNIILIASVSLSNGSRIERNRGKGDKPEEERRDR